MIRQFQARMTTYRIEVSCGSVALDVLQEGQWRAVALGKVEEGGGFLCTKTYGDRCYPDVLRHAEVHLREMVRESVRSQARMYREMGLGDWASKLEKQWNLPYQSAWT